MSDAASPRGKGGRPRRDAGPKMPQGEVDRLLVEGEVVVAADGTETRAWPSQREIARRFGVAPSLVAAFAKQARCVARREALHAGAPAASALVPVAPMPVEVKSDERAAREIERVRKTPALPPPTEPRKPGRPRRADAPVISYAELDRLLVFGEVEVQENGIAKTVYPSYRALAERYGVVVSVIADYAKSRNCVRRRKAAETRVAIRTEEKIIEKRADAVAVGEDRLVQMIDSFLLSFESALEEGRVRSDSPADVNTLARLKTFIQGGADSRQEVRAMLSLESLQERYARRMREQRDVTPEMAGVIDARAPSVEAGERIAPSSAPEQTPST